MKSIAIIVLVVLILFSGIRADAADDSQLSSTQPIPANAVPYMKTIAVLTFCNRDKVAKVLNTRLLIEITKGLAEKGDASAITKDEVERVHQQARIYMSGTDFGLQIAALSADQKMGLCASASESASNLLAESP